MAKDEPGTAVADGDAGGDTGEQETWLTGVEGLKDGVAKTLEKFGSLGDALNAHVDLEILRGNSIALPKEGATDGEKVDQMAKIYAKLGRPMTSDGYEMEAPAELPDGLKWSDEAAAEFKTLAHGLGLNQSQLDALVKFDTARQIRGMEVARAAHEEAETNAKAEEKTASDKALAELRTEWGDDFDNKVELAEKAYEQLGKNLAQRTKLFYQIYLDKLAEDTLIQGAGAASKDEGGFDFKYKTVDK